MRANKILGCSQTEPSDTDISKSTLTTSFDSENIIFLEPLSLDYQGIEKWYFKKVVPGLAAGTRKLIRIERDGRIVAMGIAKKEDAELKICTVRVLPEYEGKGIGIRIFRDLMSWLGTSKPLLSVSQDKILDFERIFEYYGFQLTSSHLGIYRTGMVEYFYNETILISAFFNRDK